MALVDVNKLRRDQAALKSEMQKICDGALTRSDKKMTSEEDSKYNELRSQVADFDKRIEEADKNNQKEMGNPGNTGSEGLYNSKPENKRAYSNTETRSYVDKIRDENPLSDGIRAEDVSLDKAICGLITGRWDGAELEQRVMSTTVNSGGGYTVPIALSADLIGMALNKMRVREAGATFIDMQTKTLTTPRLEGLPTSKWVGENAAYGEFSDCTFGAVTLTAKKLMSITSMSLELFEDGQNIGNIVSDAIAASLALEFDRVALLGLAANGEPVGVANDSNIQSIAIDGGLSSVEYPQPYRPFSRAVELIEDENESPNAVIFAPKLSGTIDRLVDTTGQPLRAPASWERLKKYVTKQIPTNLGTAEDETLAIVGDWSKLLVGLRSSINILITQQVGDAFTKAQVYMRAIMRGDVAVARPKAFCKLTGIKYGAAQVSNLPSGTVES